MMKASLVRGFLLFMKLTFVGDSGIINSRALHYKRF